ncbi:hypothetical protein [Streptococcus intermedius]
MEKNVAVYEITDEITEIVLDNNKIKNIDEIFKTIIENHSSHVSVVAEVLEDGDGILKKFKQSPEDFDINLFPEKLLESERSSSTNFRKKSIRSGFLFIKESEDSLLLLKLEKTSVADTETFKLVAQLGTEKTYYKACIARKDLSTIEVIDKNRKVASYWMSDFLGLQEARNSRVNSLELIKLVENKGLFSTEVKEKQNFSDIVSETKSYIFDHNMFDKSELIDFLNSRELIDIPTDIENYEDNFFAIEASQLDASFTIDVKVLRDKYKDEIRISSDTVIKTDNFEKLKRRKQIKFEDNKIILTVSNDFINEVSSKIGNINAE